MAKKLKSAHRFSRRFRPGQRPECLGACLPKGFTTALFAFEFIHNERRVGAMTTFAIGDGDIRRTKSCEKLCRIAGPLPVTSLIGHCDDAPGARA